MPNYIALLRAVNVSGSNRVPMSDLRAIAVDLGFGNPRTLLQSGNLVFQVDGRLPNEIEIALAASLLDRLGVQTDVFVRTRDEWEGMIMANPLSEAAVSDPSHMVVVFTNETPSGDRVEALRAAIKGREAVVSHGRQLYATYPDGIGESKLTIGLIEKKLGIRGTGRNWNTILKLAELCRN